MSSPLLIALHWRVSKVLAVHRRLKVAGQLFSNRVPSSVGEWFSDSPDSREMAWTLLAELDEPCLLRCIALHPLRDSSQKLDAWRLLKLVYSYSNDICPVGLQLSIHVLLPHIFSFFFFHLVLSFRTPRVCAPTRQKRLMLWQGTWKGRRFAWWHGRRYRTAPDGRPVLCPSSVIFICIG